MKTLHLLLGLFLLINVNTTWGQSSERHPILPKFCCSNSVFGDLDGDGDNDVILFDYNGFFWYENADGQGNFSDTPTFIQPPNIGGDVQLVDFEQDGDLDLVSYHALRVYLLLNEDGLGNFGNPIVLHEANGTSFQFHGFADLNGDRFPDMLLQSFGGDRSLKWFPNRNGALDASIDIYDDHFARGPAIFDDMDGDGDIDINLMVDLANGNVEHEYLWLKNTDGQGNFEIQQPNIIIHRFVSHRMVDMDGDDKKDLILFSQDNTAGNVYHIYQQPGDAGDSWPLIQVDTTDLSANSTAAKFFFYDYDLDGDNDMLIISYQGFDQLIALNNPGDGRLEDVQLIQEFTQAGLNGFLADLNSDDLPDLAISQSAGGFVEWYQYDTGNKIFEQSGTIFQQDDIFGWGGYAHADLDGDEDTDIVLYQLSNNQLVRLLFEGGEYVHSTFTHPEIQRLNQIALADLDQDGAPDLIYYDALLNTVGWLKNTGAQFETSGFTPITTEYAGDFRFGDMDGDGDTDVIFGSSNARQGVGIVYLENTDGKGNFAPERFIYDPIDFPRGRNATGSVLVDLDDDDDLDIAFSNNDSLYWMENIDRASEFRFHGIDRTSLIYNVEAGDLDTDGDPDLVLGPSIPLSHSWTENLDGKGRFGAIQSLPSSRLFERIYPVDWDLDGDQDLIYIGNRIYWEENLDGNANFADRAFLNNEFFNFSLLDSRADVDQDGFPDFILPRAWLENLEGQPALKGSFFFDQNANGIRDAGETGMADRPFSVQAGQLAFFSADDGSFLVRRRAGEYVIEPSPDPLFRITTDSARYHIQLDASDVDGLDFGLAAVGEQSEMELRFTAASIARCSRVVRHWLSYHNTGNQSLSGWLRLQYDPLTTLVDSNTPPDSTNGQQLFWRVDDLLPGQKTQIEVQLQMPDFMQVATELLHQVDFTGQSQAGQPYSQQIESKNVVRCAYDPNDKQLFPARAGVVPEYERSERLEYLIRFQNTGNDTAFLVELRDQLHPHLDPESLQVLDASHPYQARLDADGELRFRFEDIRLPDSTTNEVASHGFVRFAISHFPNAPRGALVHNVAAIYFDFNSPIYTNKVVHRIKRGSVSTQTPTQQAEELSILAHPNPFQQHVSWTLVGKVPTTEMEMQLYDLTGRQLWSQTFVGTNSSMHQFQAPMGIYFYRLVEAGSGKILGSGKLIHQHVD
ncbi:MAG: T9SS type A sorting domain-containing protein [Bacteroidota bacterium]